MAKKYFIKRKIYIDKKTKAELGTACYETIEDAVVTKDGKKLPDVLFELRNKKYVYSSKIPTNVTVGGIAAGTVLYGLTLDEILDKMFHKVTPPTVSASEDIVFVQPGTQKIPKFNVEVIKGTNDIQSVSILDSDSNVVLLTTSLNISFTAEMPISKNTQYTIIAQDTSGVTDTATVEYIINA